MTVEAEEATIETGDRSDVSGTVVTVLLALVDAHSSEVGVAQALALAGEGRSFSTLGDPTVGSSQSEIVALFNAAALVTGDGAVGLHVGEMLLHSPDSADFVDRLSALGSPEVAFKHVAPLAEHFETRSEAAALEVGADHALIRVTPRGDESRHAHLCEMTRGLLSEVPALYGLGPALISETECSARGGRCCLYSLSWDDPWTEPPIRSSTGRTGGESPFRDDDGAGLPDRKELAPEDPMTGFAADRITTELQEEVSRLSTLMEGAFASTTELLRDDVDSLLAEIAARADAVVSTHRYLLMVRVRPGTPIQLHHRGLEPDEAQIMAAELWREHPGDDAGGQIIVDIASPRHLYGRLAAYFPAGGAHPPFEAKALRLYAEYASAALDIFDVLTEARQSDATARTLLSFSEALSRTTDPADLVQLLADTVPTITGCDQSSVYLWDRQRGHLAIGARTEGTEWQSAHLGPIVPVSATDSPRGRNRAGPRSGDGWLGVEDKGRAAVVDQQLTVRTDSPLIDHMINRREVMVLDGSTEDPLLRNLLDRSRTAASVVAPLFANGEFLGVVTANFGPEASTAGIRDADLHERLSGLADQAATILQNLELLEKISHMAWHDALTGLPNRRLFEDRVEQELVRSRRLGEPVCMFFVDLDHFKMVNDTHGHAAGDDLIQQVGRRLVDTVRRQDTVARVGGDEFAILLPGLSDQLSIDELAQRSLEAVSAPFVVFDEQVETTASIGIAMAPGHGDTYDELLSRADEAMYRAKDRGRNAFQMYAESEVDPTTGGPVIDERTLNADLIHALDHEEFFVLYQPYIDLRTSHVVGVEALVRWRHPALGILEPPSFISVAEKSDIIVDLDTWVLQQTCRQARIWLDHGLSPLRLSVNLATRDLSNAALFDTVDQILDETGIDPSMLELEITERVILDKLGPAKENIERLRRLGVHFSIDDFGTGKSTLSRIGSFPVSTLKIDQSFVQVLGPDGDSNALVTAIISMADRLGLACVAEGVETSLQSRVLLQRGCTTAQGYFFSPPLAAEAIETMMATIAAADGPIDLGGTAG